MRVTLYRSNCLEVPENCTYPHKVEVTGKDSLIEAVKHDYVCADADCHFGWIFDAVNIRYGIAYLDG